MSIAQRRKSCENRNAGNLLRGKNYFYKSTPAFAHVVTLFSIKGTNSALDWISYPECLSSYSRFSTTTKTSYRQSRSTFLITTMSREAYAPPTLQPQGSNYGAASAELAGPTTQYLCGSCNSKVQLKKGDPIRCKDCGHRVLYKERTKRYVKSGEVGDGVVG